MAQNPWDNDPIVGKVPGTTTAAPPAVPQPRAPTLPQKRKQEYDRTNQTMELDKKQDARADTAQEISIGKDAREQAEFNRKQREHELTGGVETSESEKTAGFLATQLTGHMDAINRITKENPEAVQPGWIETAADATGSPRLRDMVISDKTRSARQSLNNRYALATDVLLTLGTGAAYTEQQFKTYSEAYSPKVTDTPETLQEKKRMMREAIEAARVKSGTAVVNIDRAIAALDKLYGGNSEAEPSTTATPHTIADIAADPKLQKSGEKRYIPAPAEANAAHAQWIKAHPNASAMEYNNFRKELARQYGIPGYENDQPGDVDLAETEAFLNYFREHPNAQVPDMGYEKQLDAAERMSAKAGNLMGEEVQTGLIKAANAGGFGIPKALMSDDQAMALEQAEARNPNAAMLGDIAGSVAPSVALERGMATAATNVLGREAPLAASLAAEGLYNGARGFNEAGEGEGLTGAAIGAGTGVLGAIGGRAVARGARGFMDPATVARVDELEPKGFAQSLPGVDDTGSTDLTTLQRMGLGKVEEIGQGIPGVRGAREAANKSWNLKNSNDVLREVGEQLPKGTEAGTAANEAVNRILGQRYNAIRPQIVGSFDQSFTNAIRALKAQATTKTEKALFAEIDAVGKKFAKGTYDGNSFKDADGYLRGLVNDWSKVDATATPDASVYHRMARVADKYRSQLRAQVSRNTPEIAEDLRKLDRAWAKQMRLERASLSALKNDGVYSPGELIQASKTLDTSKNKGMSARGKAFMQEGAANAAKIMGSKPIPETPSWLQTGGVTYAAQQLLGLPVAMTAGAAAYGPGIKRVVQALAAGERPEVLEKIMKVIPPEALAAAIARYKATED